jgi:hypothetical protein
MASFLLNQRGPGDAASLEERMARKREGDDERLAAAREIASHRRIREMLEERGLAAEVAEQVARSIAAFAETLDDGARCAMVEGAVVAHRVQVQAQRIRPGPGSDELQAIFQDFAVELKKLDEGLRLLTSYLVRIRKQAERRRAPRLVH